MSDQNYYQQGYVQQGGQPQGYQQGYVQQGGQPQGYQQVYPQQNPQMYQQTYPQQGYQQPIGGGIKPPQPKKSKTGLIVGIVIAAIALIAGIILLIFRDKIFGSDDEKKTTEDITTEFTYEPTETTTEIAVEIEGGYDTPDDLVSNFWEGYEYCNKDQIYQCFYLEDELGASSAESNYNNAVANQDNIQVFYDEVTATFEDGSTDLVSGVDFTIVAVKVAHIEVPMIRIVDGDIYDIVDIYDGTVMQLENGKWYMADMAQTDVEVIGVTSGDDGSHDGGNENPGNSGSSQVDETMYLGYGDLKTMGDSICGYVDVPSEWVVFQEIGGIDGADYYYQMSNPTGTAIITMCAYDNQTSAEEAAIAIYDSLEAEGVAEDLQGATVTIGNYEAKQVYCKYDGIYLVTYSFRAEDDRLHYVAVEMPEDSINIVLNIEGTYRFEE